MTRGAKSSVMRYLPLQGEAKIDRVETFGFQLVQPLDDFIGLPGDAKGVDHFRRHEACFVRFPLTTKLSGRGLTQLGCEFRQW